MPFVEVKLEVALAGARTWERKSKLAFLVDLEDETVEFFATDYDASLRMTRRFHEMTGLALGDLICESQWRDIKGGVAAGDDRYAPGADAAAFLAARGLEPWAPEAAAEEIGPAFR
jgi:hypothetical protein